MIKEGPKSTEVPKTKWIYLNCDADGKPKPTVTWLQNGKVIPDNKYKVRLELGTYPFLLPQSLNNVF